MKNKFISRNFLLIAFLVLSLIVSSTTAVSAEEMTTITAEESGDSMETPIVPSDTDSTGDDANYENGIDGAGDDFSAGEPMDNSQSFENGTSDVIIDDDSAEESIEDCREDSTEINIDGITSANIIFEDDIVFINPCYSDTMSVSDLVEAPEAEAPDPAEVATVLAGETTDSTTYYTNDADAAAVIRSCMTARAQTISVGYAGKESSYSAKMSSIFLQALNHTGICNQGDYLRWVYGGYTGSLSGYTSNGTDYIVFTYTMTYYTTADQEAVFASAVDGVFSELGIYGLSTEYEKIEAIYRYICSHVTYDYTNLNDSSYKLKYTAYAALINGTSVCQGYATLFYYMALKAGIDARFISGNANGGRHGWNIVRLNGLYYDMDSTWDSNFGSVVENYRYFLKCNADFPGHTRDADYNSDSFNTAYPMAGESYQIQPEETVTVYGHSLVLDGKIGLIFYLDISDAAKAVENSYVSMKNSVTGAENDVYMTDAVEKDGYYRFSYSLTAQEMSDPIVLTFYEGSTGEVLCTDTYSASDYAEEQIADGNSVSDLVAAMLDYGTCAQYYFDYQTGSPANASLSTDGSDRTIADVDASALAQYARVKTGTMPEGIHTYGESLVLNDGVSVKFYFQLEDGAQISDYTASLVSGGSSTTLQWQESGDASCYYVSIDNINAADLDAMYEVSVSNGTSAGNVRYGAMTYVYNTLSAADGVSDSLKNLCRSLYYYSQAADQYFTE